MNILLTLLSGVIAYLLGSLNLAIFLSRRMLKKDIRQFGSGNAGATNVTRTMGWKAGLAVIGFDAVKGIAGMLIGQAIAGESGFLLAGICAVLGHTMPVFHGFKGGKGVATGAAVYAMMDWRGFLIILLVFVITVALTRYVSLGSILGALSFPVSIAVLPGFSLWMFLCSLLISGFVIFMHRENIRRLLAGTERKLSLKK